MSNEKLLPIVPGCEALVIRGRCVGQSVKVLERFTPEYIEREGLAVIPGYIGEWACLLRDGCLRIVARESSLMRIDGHKPEGLDCLIGRSITINVGKFK